MMYGENFSPNQAQEATGVELCRCNENGDIGRTGKFKEKPLPYGSAELIDENFSMIAPYSFIFDFIERHLVKVRQAGATDIHLHILVAYSDQCNLEFEPKLLQKISRSGLPLTMSVYEE
jgi:hypothetical protein